LIVAVGAALFIPLCIPLVMGRVFALDDLGTQNAPLRHLYRDALRAGDSFLWSPSLFSGFFIFGEGQAGMAHPLHLVLYRLLPLSTAINIEIVTSYLLMLAGMRLLLLRLGLSVEASWFGAVVFTFSGFNLLHLMHVNAIAVIAHAPWLLLATHVLLTSSDRRARAYAFAAVVFLIASQILLGHPQSVWMTGLAVAYMALCLLPAAGWPRLLLLGGAAGLGVMAGAVQLLPTLDVLRESTRHASSLDFRLSFSLPPLNLVQLWSPYAFRFRIHAPPEGFLIHEFSIYNGAFCTLALAWMVVRWRALTRRGLVAALLLFAAASLVIALGRYAGIYTWLARLPGVGTFRAPVRHIVLFHLALSGIAAVAFEDIVAMVRTRDTIELRRLWPVATLVALSVATTLAAALLTDSAWALEHGLVLSNIMRAGPWSGVVIVVALLLVLAARGQRWPVPMIVLVVACDQGLWGYHYLYRSGFPQTIAALATSAPLPPEAVAGELVQARKGTPPDLGVFRSLRMLDGYVGLPPSSILDRADPLAQRLAGLAWRPAAIGGWIRVSDSMPRARLVARVRQTGTIQADLPDVDISHTALVDRPMEPLSGAAGEARVVSDRPGHLVVAATAPGRQLLITTERYHDGWRAMEDDHDCPTWRVYGDYLGCVVAPGTHTVTFRFAPDSVRNGIALSAAAVALTLMATVLVWRHPRPTTA